MLATTWLEQSTNILVKAGISSARLDCLVLLEDISGKEKSWLLAHPEFELSDTQVDELHDKIARRATHEPLAYIRGFTEFYGRRFTINHHVLEPRSESETMVELLLKTVQTESVAPLNIADIGTGSGALAITAKLELPASTVMATDIDSSCLGVAHTNARELRAQVNFSEGDLLEPLMNSTASPTLLLCNLPYVPDHFTINRAAMSEPKKAIFGGPDGLDMYKRLFIQIANYSQSIPYIFTESLPFQHHALAGLARAHGYALERNQDLIQVFRSID